MCSPGYICTTFEAWNEKLVIGLDGYNWIKLVIGL